ncbi:MAG TPA: FAD-dependent oxidoreductase [Anaerolineales bacterium]|nr:FAD-dependent oxidoreductase [Anaerolineales bacterium]
MTTLSTQLLVVGGGATGLGVGWDASLRGLSVVVAEQGDLGEGTSGRYHGLLHSGGRYVLSDPESARACAAENLILRRIAPHTIEDTGGLFIHTAHDPPHFPDDWLAACRAASVPVDECSSTAARAAEPLLTPNISRAFRVHDAALDSFELLHGLHAAIQKAGGRVLLRHRLERLVVRDGGFLAALATSAGEVVHIEAQIVVNAAGPHAGRVAAMAGVALPLALGKGAMVAMATRLVNTVINRCKPPSDGDIIVPVGTVAVLGTTDTPTTSPDDVLVQAWEVDRLVDEAAILLPGIASHRALRAWAGIRPLHRPPHATHTETRDLPRGHALIDHGHEAGPPGFITIIGGKLTTFRLMAEETVDRACAILGHSAVCRTAHTLIEPSQPSHHRLPRRLERLTRATARIGIVCECELVTADDLDRALESDPTHDLDDLRRDLRLGMGPCQASFCAYRAAAVVASLANGNGPPPISGMRSFLEERWRGLRPLMFGGGLRQLELTRRVYQDLLAVDEAADGQ